MSLNVPRTLLRATCEQKESTAIFLLAGIFYGVGVSGGALMVTFSLNFESLKVRTV